MKVIKRLFWAAVIIWAVAWGYNNRATVIPKATTLVNNTRTNLVAALSGNLSSRLLDEGSAASAASATSQTTSHTTTKSKTQSTVKKHAANATPIESIVQNTTLSKTYYYHFNRQLSATGREVFKEAVATYNQTGLVNLVPGSAREHQNSIEFSVYFKKMPTGDTTIELGHGGPQITKQVSIRGTSYWNTATASLNGDYGSAFSKAVAVHELGHALGLDHSSSTLSVMYPVSQGKSTLSSGDVAALQEIYQRS
ncbi:peptidase M10 [Lactiplantibacillus garii]|uniref:Peptidase M10 n=1 Tax=Lactiplantibacillus garii TaxID=2306423 RepID=A0A426D3J9_9LACO|nr:matrixin family metalloprotease [Lactiplantibacillus garii]RRK09257.1 peptidase M10 [Lactiplantibacillus garii]